ncbi:hypothetical protein [Peptoniphilus obesi]|uniref:hypothetical protein n=1 Tax=Peptoniphilus obesi TaxID=1472765 RepID=UPI0004B75249|nr:hypothetical protein [Peptoniphilus obesi]
MTVNVVHEIRKALLSLALEWCPSNHGVIINYDRCWAKNVEDQIVMKDILV